MGSENILNGDKVFFLSAEEAGKQPTDLSMTMRVSPIMVIVRAVGGFVLLTKTITLQAWSTLPVVCVLNG